MITVKFLLCGELLTGFEISGHSGYSEEGSDIICSAVSSAAIMTANTVTEIQRMDAEITENDGFLNMNLSVEQARGAQVILDGFRLHMNALSQVYPKFIKVKNSEV